MRYTVHFNGTREQQFEQALAECRIWLGSQRLRKFIKGLREFQGSLAYKMRMTYFCAGFAGMKGRTVVHALFTEAFVKGN